MKEQNPNTNSTLRTTNPLHPASANAIWVAELFKNLIDTKFTPITLNIPPVPKIILESFTENFIAPLGKNIQDWLNSHSKPLLRIAEFWKEFERKYPATEEQGLDILARYNWFVSPTMPIGLMYDVIHIGSQQGNRSKEVNSLFVSYFTSNDFTRLDEYVRTWSTNALLKKPTRILYGCVHLMKQKQPGFNPCNFVLPVLVAQIDGVKHDFLRSKGLTPSGSRWMDESRNDVKWIQWFKDHVGSGDMDELASNVLLDMLFQKAYPSIPLRKAASFNRHKILHGESLNYGRIDNTLRAFMLLDFLASLE